MTQVNSDLLRRANPGRVRPRTIEEYVETPVPIPKATGAARQCRSWGLRGQGEQAPRWVHTL